MLAVQAMRFGAPSVLAPQQVPDPVAGPGQVEVAMTAADVLVVEAQVRAGWGREYFPVEPPYVPGDGISGTVTAVGADVDPCWLGRRVVAYTDSQGGYADRAAVSTDKLVVVPAGLSLVDAAALTHDGPMALTALQTADLSPSEQVLVLGANGGAGNLLVQLAAGIGARVIGTARGERKRSYVRWAGADVVVDPSAADWLNRVRAEAGGPVDVVFDGVGGSLGSAAFDLVADGGRFFAYGASTGGFAQIDPTTATRRGVAVFGLAQLAEARTRVTALAEQAMAAAVEGRLRPLVGKTFGLEQAAEAHTAIEDRSVLGKILLTTDGAGAAAEPGLPGRSSAAQTRS